MSDHRSRDNEGQSYHPLPDLDEDAAKTRPHGTGSTTTLRRSTTRRVAGPWSMTGRYIPSLVASRLRDLHAHS